MSDPHMYILTPDTNRYILDQSNLKDLMSISSLNKTNRKYTGNYLRSLYNSLKLDYHYDFTDSDFTEKMIKTLNGIDLSVEGSSLKDKVNKINNLDIKFYLETYEYAKGMNMYVDEEYERLHKVNVMVLAEEELLARISEDPTIETTDAGIMSKLREKYNDVKDHYGVYLSSEGIIEGGKIDVVFYESKLKLDNLNKVFKDDVLLIEIPKEKFGPYSPPSPH